MTRLEVKKTCKLYIGGAFPRTESGRSYPLRDRKGGLIANVSLASRKDFRNAVVAARKAQPSWAGATAYLRAQILYRIAEMMEGRRAQLASELCLMGATARQAEMEVEAAVDHLVHYAGWADKFSQLFSTVNPVSSPHFNFSVPEPVGVVALLPPEKSGLLGLVGAMAPVLCAGNAAVLLAPQQQPLCAVTLGEILNTSDLPGGVVNLSTGSRDELLPVLATHLDVDGVVLYGGTVEEQTTLQDGAAESLRRVSFYEAVAEDPYRILDFCEIKTTWHPVGL